MRSIGRFLVSIAELAEAEGRVLRRHVIELAAAAALGILTLILAVVGSSLVLYGFYHMVLSWSNIATAAITTGILTLAGAGGLVWINLKNLNREEPKSTTP